MISITTVDVTKLAIRVILQDVKRVYNSIKHGLLSGLGSDLVIVIAVCGVPYAAVCKNF